MLASADVPDNGRTKYDSSVEVEEHECDLHAFVGLGVPHSIVSQDASNMHERVTDFCDVHAHNNKIR